MIDTATIATWPRWRQALCLVGVAAVTAFAVYSWVAEARRDAWHAAKQEEARLYSDYRSRVLDAVMLPEWRTQLAALEAEAARLDASLPRGDELPALLARIAEAAAERGLAIETLRLRAAVGQNHHLEHPLEIAVQGGFHALGLFIADIVALPHIVTLHDFTLVPATRDEALRLTATGKLYSVDEAGL